MAEEKPSLHIDTDWKRQAQEEKRRLAEQEKARSTAAPAAASTGAGGTIPSGLGAAGMPPTTETGATSPSASGRSTPAGARAETPQATFAGLISQVMTQTLFHLGELAPRGGEPVVNLDMAKHQIDTLAVLEDKTRGNLTDEEKRLLDSVLYEVRMRYVNVASQYIT